MRQARLAFEQENDPLAASEFARIRENYSGSRAAEQATLLLAQTRLLQGQAQQALDAPATDAGSMIDAVPTAGTTLPVPSKNAMVPLTTVNTR